MKRCIVLLLLWVFVAVTAGAQPRTGAPSLVDSREACLSLEGVWKPASNGWQASCEVPWSQPDCLRLGGAWTQVAKLAAGGFCRAGISELAVAQQCIDRGGNWAPIGSRAPQCTFEPVAKARTSKAADAGKVCNSQKDCSYSCIYQGPDGDLGAPVAGHCRASRDTAGCFSLVENGRSTGKICVN